VKLKQVLGNFYKERDRVTLTAEKGNFNKRNGLIHLEDNVVISTSSGAKLTTDSLDWDRKGQLVSSQALVNIQREGMTLEGQGVYGLTDLKDMQFNKAVKLNIFSKDNQGKATKGERTVITCDGPLTVDYGKQIAIFNNNVKVERPDSVIYCDRLQVYFSTSNKGESSKNEGSLVDGSSIDRFIAWGNVRILHGENISYSEQATYIAADKRLSLSGRPQLVIYQTENMNAAFGN